MFAMTSNVCSYSNAVNSWVAVGCTISDVTASVPFPSGRHKVFRVFTNSADPYIYTGITSAELQGTSVQSKQLTFGAWLWTDSGQPFTAASGDYALRVDCDTYTPMAAPFSLSNVPNLIYAAGSAFLSNSTFTLRIDGVSSIGDYFYVAMPHVGYSEGYLSVLPEWDLTLESQKVQTQHRGRSGRLTTYKWGQYDAVKFSLSYVNSLTRNVINNSYWNNNARVLFGSSDGTVIVDGIIVTAKAPINKNVEPYTNLWKGTIEMNGF